MSVEIDLAPRNPEVLQNALHALYSPGNSQYRKFLTRGQFANEYAPAKTSVQKVSKYLSGQGLRVGSTNSPFLLRATGPSGQIEEAFHTKLSNYVDPSGIRYFANSEPVSVPVSLSGDVLGVVGLTNTARLRSESALTHADPPVKDATAATPPTTPASSSCETGYPTTQQLFQSIVGGSNVALGYGDGPFCIGLTPSQTNSIGCSSVEVSRVVKRRACIVPA
ncbi:MAG: protease pro-enzyme activation domain-containing protein [Trebonia sp.]